VVGTLKFNINTIDKLLHFQSKMNYETPMKIKRRNPFGQEDYRTNKNVKNDMETIYGLYGCTLVLIFSERTLRMLKQGGKPHRATVDYVEVRQCQRCSGKGELIPCSYCSREICGNSCAIQCERCQEIYCASCSTIK
jgi:hypothetical protein